MSAPVSSVLVVGGGVIGCASALALRKCGVAVTVLDRGAAREAPGETGAASWAAAGIVGAQIERLPDGPLARLCLASRARYPALAAEIRELTGLDVQLRPVGVIAPAFTEASLAAMAAAVAWHEPAGFRAERLDAAGARAIEPALSPAITGALRFPDELRIDPPSLVAALRAAIERAGGVLRTGAPVRRIVREGGRARGVELEDGTLLEADRVVLAAGSWSSRIEGAALRADAVSPARGQMIELRVGEPVIRGVVDGPDCYLSPRDDGRVLVGSTVEHVGFRRGADARAVSEKLAAAIRLVPALGDATVSAAWSGFRPFTADELPLLGPGAIDGLVIASGHFRNGVTLAPITGEIVAALVTGATPPVDLTPFDPLRRIAAHRA